MSVLVSWTVAPQGHNCHRDHVLYDTILFRFRLLTAIRYRFPALRQTVPNGAPLLAAIVVVLSGRAISPAPRRGCQREP